MRPTASRVREALFSILGQRLGGMRALDLFAGAGTLGIEAASRGATSVVFVEHDRQVARLLGESATLLCGVATSEILVMDALAAIGLLARRGQQFDVIFLDPPYGQGLARTAIETLTADAATLLAQGGRIVAETDVREELPAEPGGVVLPAPRRLYGRTALTVFERTAG